MRENGLVRAREIEIAPTVEQWQDFLVTVAVPAYEQWCGQGLLRRSFYLPGRDLAIKVGRVQRAVIGCVADY